ncbi:MULTISPECIES: hypothetical protein [Bacillus]|uniref:hypothetical protein n=1 Tax=Bacillus TaxID=1386 RepID=UPI002E23CB19|nr:hypothetical protein [Bacillus smithii]MED4883530.1 hypothetical protein [Bacillus smithii]MED4926194.1 hypothetical protein [Bacillus smithii]
MKRLGMLLALVVVIIAIGYDLKIGTLPSNQPKTSPFSLSAPAAHSSIPYKEIKIHSGDTVLSVAERIQQGTLPVSIDEVIHDFETLNNGLKPEDIMVGRTYKFPVYE